MLKKGFLDLVNNNEKLIINADDFGISHSSNIAIKNCFERGVIDSATIMVNMEGFDEAVEISRNIKLPVGLHFNLTLGKPISKNIDSLVNDKGEFYSRKKFIQKYFLGIIKLKDVMKEYLAQLNRFKSNLVLDHVDSHQHIHMLPKIFDSIAEICEEQKTPLRLTQQHYANNLSFNKKLRSYLLSKLVVRAKKKWSSKIILNDYLTSIFDVMNNEKKPTMDKYKNIFDNLSSGFTELMVHPTIKNINNEEKKLTRISNVSIIEYEILMSDEFVGLLNDAKFERSLYSSI